MINSDTISAGLTIWQKRHMPRAPRFWGPRAYSLLFPPEFFVLCFIAGPKWCASAGPKEPKFPRKREAPKFKKRGPKERGPKRFFRSLFQRGGPNSPSATENARPKNLKREGPKGILFPAVSVSARGPKEPMVPRKLEAPKFKNRGPKERGPKWFFRSLFQRGIQTAWAPMDQTRSPT
jgi:hypothetical protein